MPGRPVVITGIGAISVAGLGAEALWLAASQGISGARPVRLTRDVNNSVKVAAQIPELNLPEIFPDKKTGFYDRCTAFALMAADEAVRDAGLADAMPFGNRSSVIVGTGVAGIGSIEDGTLTLAAGKRPDPLTVPRAMTSAAASQVGMAYGCTGTTFVISSACASSSQALGMALMMVRAGLTDRVIVAGTEAIVTPGGFKAWEAMRVLSPDLCRPFSKGRNGLLLGEAGAALIVEAEDTALARGARIRARLLGYGTTSDAKDILRPDLDGAADAMAAALDDAGVAPGAIDYVNAHGTGTVLNDTTESEAIRRVFGNHAADLPVSSTKPVHGHTLGAAGAVEVVITVRALEEGRIPPTINFAAADPHCAIDCVPNVGRDKPIGLALSNSFAFGGINAALVIGRAA
ncbi:beta-ketoacyl-[acyl-carrier-protein] synthase family protein [Phreatobacter sp. AB_2022a]|uniref:beta-ketoacyl-[acyl-carrier-protein] synthase family protein n=1 Tax=Phreatobacter sp. AB_2022a TaxID=3003134 RepID=UPI0022871E03|nr:beta-ketoacyl-[acyl-carrier-protein] synthase family protein [Phreatobacter sp. AB_2022a]MCZ0732953.1 beta-ketoacyl-[acyl-carrier-protein] synthase family protein [Phreatobacter sp. AB_2022a]